MKSEEPPVFIKYLQRVIKHTGFLVTGIIGFAVLGVIDLFLPTIDLKIAYILILAVSLIIANYLVYLDMSKENKDLRQKVDDLECKKPIIDVWFPNNDVKKPLVKTLTLHTLPPMPDYDAKVEEKKNELLIKGHNENTLSKYVVRIQTKNANYFNEVENYLEQYRKYIEQLYECTCDRAYAVSVAVENSGNIPANSLTLDFLMPEGFVIPEPQHRYDREKASFQEIAYHVFQPKEPKPFLSLSDFSIPLIEPRALLDDFSIASRSPDYVQKADGVHIIYNIEKLIQHNPFDNLEAFWVWLGEIENEQTWEILIKITSAELSQPVERRLYIEIKKP